MMYASESPFDEALSKPFLGKPARKKWSLLSTSTAATAVASMFSELDYEDSEEEEEEDDSEDEYYSSSDDDDDEECYDYEAPVLQHGEEIVVLEKTEGEQDDEAELTFDAATFKPMDVEAALLQERRGSFAEMHLSLSQIFEIQKDLSALVNSQDGDIENLHSKALDASEHAQTGVKHLMKMNQEQELTQQRRSFLGMFFIVLVASFWVFGGGAGDVDEATFSP